MSLLALLIVAVVVVGLGAIAYFSPIDQRFKNLLYGLAVLVVVIYVIYALFSLVGGADNGWPHDRVIVR
jgi:FtsH-binding integral membrane protein